VPDDFDIVFWADGIGIEAGVALVVSERRPVIQ
jgi:hypothetical protein